MSAESVGSTAADQVDAGYAAGVLQATAGDPDDSDGPVEARPLGWRSRFGPLVLVGLVVLVVDQLTKIWAVASLSDRNIDLFWTLRLNLIRNTGSAFGLGTQFGRWLAVVITIVVVAMIFYARRVDDRRMLLLFGAIIGGAIGNLVDRALRADNGLMTGGVIDFIDFQWWPVFNVADMAVVLGALGLMAISLREPA